VDGSGSSGTSGVSGSSGSSGINGSGLSTAGEFATSFELPGDLGGGNCQILNQVGVQIGTGTWQFQYTSSGVNDPNGPCFILKVCCIASGG
jgi:hypothetical protein